MWLFSKICVQSPGIFGLTTSGDCSNLLPNQAKGKMGSDSLTATRYHLSLPSVLDGNLFSSFSNNSFASLAVGSSDDLILNVCQFKRTGRTTLVLGRIEVTRVYGRFHVVCRRFSIENLAHVRNSVTELFYQSLYVTEIVLPIYWGLFLEGSLA